MANRDTDEKKIANNSTLESPKGKVEGRLSNEMKSLNVDEDDPKLCQVNEAEGSRQAHEVSLLESDNPEETNRAPVGVLAEEKEVDPVFDGAETPKLEATRSSPSKLLDLDLLPKKAVAFKNYVKERGVLAISTALCRLSHKDNEGLSDRKEKNSSSTMGFNEEEDSSTESKLKEVSQKIGKRSTWNSLSFIKTRMLLINQVDDVNVKDLAEEPAMKGRVLVYTRLGCQDCKEVRTFMRQKRLKFVEINIDIYPSRKLELEKRTGSSSVPLVYLNEFLVGGLSELKKMDESGELDENIEDLINEEPSPAAPSQPLPGEDDESGSGEVDKFASIVRKMKDSITIKDRFYKLRRFTNCFLGSEAVDFLSEDQYFEREDAVEFGRMLASKHFFRHVMNENIFEDGNHLYRFLEHDPTVLTECYNIPRGMLDVEPKPITEIASRLRCLSSGIIEAYVSEGGRYVDYRSIDGSEEFKRYLRTIEELQRVEVHDLSREEKLAFFINLYNMMAIHAILLWGYPLGALDRARFFRDFNYVIGGSPYSLSAIYNGILRGNQRPPENLIKPFGERDKRFKVALPYPEPLVHFALAFGSKSGPTLRCYSPDNIDEELVEAARHFLRNGGLVLDTEAKVASVNKILQWYGGDFGKNEIELLKHVANYLEPRKVEELLDLLASTQLKVIYQPYDWGWNY